MTDRNAAVLGDNTGCNDVLSFEASDVTGTYRVVADDVQKELPAGAVARAIAAQMRLPTNVPWALRSETSAFLDDEKAIGDQIRPGSQLTLTPKAHLGGR